MIGIDTGFLLALPDRRDHWHASAAAWAPPVAEGWITTWPVLTEGTHLLDRGLGPLYAQRLLQEVDEGAITLWDIPRAQLPRLIGLMHLYTSLPMDLADASLVLLAEHLGHGRILTTDQRDLGAHRWKSQKPFHNLLDEPAPT
ncbi:MAG: PIN domain-containing protein [Rhodoferax sp.]